MGKNPHGPDFLTLGPSLLLLSPPPNAGLKCLRKKVTEKNAPKWRWFWHWMKESFGLRISAIAAAVHRGLKIEEKNHNFFHIFTIGLFQTKSIFFASDLSCFRVYFGLKKIL